MLIDVHCHLDAKEFENAGGVDEVLERGRAASVKAFIVSGYDRESSFAAAKLAEEQKDVFFTCGFQPEELGKYREGDLDAFYGLSRRDKCVAIGEIGLDYHFPDNPKKELQKELFVRQIELAEKADLPIVVHSRDAASDTLEILKANQARVKRGGLMHCYSYSAEMIGAFASLGLYFSFGGTSTFKNAKKVHACAKLVPAHRLLTETDSPYLSPEPCRGQFPNEPARVKYVAEHLALLRETEISALEESVFENAKRLFFKMEKVI